MQYIFLLHKRIVNGQIRDSPIRRDPGLNIQAEEAAMQRSKPEATTTVSLAMVRQRLAQVKPVPLTSLLNCKLLGKLRRDLRGFKVQVRIFLRAQETRRLF